MIFVTKKLKKLASLPSHKQQAMSVPIIVTKSFCQMGCMGFICRNLAPLKPLTVLPINV